MRIRNPPFGDYTEEQVAFDRTPWQFRRLAETGDRSRVMILAMCELRSIRYRLQNPADGSFGAYFDVAVTEYQFWISRH